MTTLFAQREAWRRGLLFLRITVGVLVLVIHGWHKAAGAVAHLRTGASWPLLDEVVAMGVPLPLAAALFATAVQLIGGLFLLAGWWTRPTAIALTVVLGGAIAQNLQAGRDPQLALLYTLAVAVFIFVGEVPWKREKVLHD